MSKTIERIVSGKCERSEILKIRENATRIIKLAIDKPTKQNEVRAKEALMACDSYLPEPLSSEYNFMGFCPSADIKRVVYIRLTAPFFALLIVNSIPLLPPST